MAGAQLIRDLEKGLEYFEERSPAGAPTFRTAVEAYSDFHWKHMRREEDQLLPLAEQYLTAEDWEAIAAAFEENTDPIAGVPQKEYESLFSRIALIAPAPIGFGDRWKQAAP
jgi:hemerythrin-like domain-containing protein